MGEGEQVLDSTEEMGHSRWRGRVLSSVEGLEGCTPSRVYDKVPLKG